MFEKDFPIQVSAVKRYLWIFWTKTAFVCSPVFFGCYGLPPFSSLLKHLSEIQKIKSNYVSFRLVLFDFAEILT